MFKKDGDSNFLDILQLGVSMKNKRRSIVFPFILISITLLMPSIIGCEKATSTGSVYEIKYTVAARGIIGEEIATVKQWMDSVEKASNGRVRFKVLVGSTTDTDNYEALIAGTGDLASNMSSVNPGRFPIMDMMSICDIGTTCRRPAQVAWDLWKTYQKEIEEEFSEIKLIAFWASAPSPIGIGFATVDKPVYTLADAKGLKIGQNSEFGIKTCVALGMAPVPAPPPTVYESLQRTIIDGSFMDPEMMDSFKLGELVKYFHAVNFHFMPFWFGLNKNSWSRLPADIQKIMEDEAAKIPGWADAYHTKAALEAIESAKSGYGLKVIEIDKDEIARWRALQDPVQQEYVAKLQKDKGIDAQKIFDTLNELYAKYDK
jgi:TRAP-type C4-dicarboxylate transport system substrate-binding protein